MKRSSATALKTGAPPRLGYKFLALLPLAGLASGVLTSILLGSPRVAPFAGIIFGGLVGGWLSRAKALRNEEWALLTVIAGADFFLSVCAVVFAGVALGYPFGVRSEMGRAEPVAAATFFGALLGGLVLIATLHLIRREAGGRPVLLKAVVGAVCGGALELLGAALAPSLGNAFAGAVEWAHFATERNSLYGNPNFVYSVLLVWQTGMALVLGLTLLRHDPRTQDISARQESAWTKKEPE